MLQDVKWEQVNFHPYTKGGVEKVLAMLKGGGGKRFWGSFYAVA